MKWREMCKIIKTNNDYTTQPSYWIRGGGTVRSTLVTLPVRIYFLPADHQSAGDDVDVLTHLELLMR